eukprot:TRINITY_DN2404_c0_g1_i1.p1 TRINITY_DN2404_c0_g1~~TRINITY_DN2404_c0_g1_i1.p1  ORF type:complete len:325 (+),score=44.21 TRINITY_DN2404_c0_g1_i1:155-1129(+)
MFVLQVRELETNPFFNSGRGSALTTKGTVEMDASIMDGSTRNCGAVSGVTTVKNPISLARTVMEKSPHVYLAFEGAEGFARESSLETVDPNYFITAENKERLAQAKKENTIQFDYSLPEAETNGAKSHNELLPTVRIHKNKIASAFKNWKLGAFGVSGSEGTFPNCAEKTPCGDERVPELQMNGVPLSVYEAETVGCVAVDIHGNCASATSTGGLINKRCGRIGDSPIIGAGTYADKMYAVSATGEGESIIRATVARDVGAVMEYKGYSLQESVDFVVNKRLENGKAGLIAVSSDGEVYCGFNTFGMFRAMATEDGFFEVGIWK